MRTVTTTMGQLVLASLQDLMKTCEIRPQGLIHRLSRHGTTTDVITIKRVFNASYNCVDATIQLYHALGVTASFGLCTVEGCAMPLDQALKRNFTIDVGIHCITLDELVVMAEAAGHHKTANRYHYQILRGECPELELIRKIAIALDTSLARVIASCEVKAMAA